MYGYANPEEMMTEMPYVGQLYANPEDREEVLRILAVKGVMEPREMAVVRRDGTRFFVLVSAREIRDSEGNLRCYQAEHMDITERKLGEEALREREIKYRSLFENSTVGIFQISPEGRLLKINSAFAKMFGYQNPEEMIREISDIGAQLYVNPDQLKHIFHQLVERKVIEQREFEMVRRDGSRFWILLSAREVRDQNSKLLYYEGTSIDITERIWAIEELGRNQDKLRELTARLMHAQETERKKISMELHDEIGQALTAVKINLVEIQKEIPSNNHSDVGVRLIETDAMIENMLEQIHQMIWGWFRRFDGTPSISRQGPVWTCIWIRADRPRGCTPIWRRRSIGSSRKL
jgi:PAS domain S-box-containing protein